MCQARPWLLVLVAAALRTQAASAEVVAIGNRNCPTCECRQDDGQEWTSVLQVDVQVGHHRTEQAPTATGDVKAIPGKFEPKPVWLPVALFSTNASVGTRVANTFTGRSDGGLNSTGTKQMGETTSWDTIAGLILGVVAVAVVGACGLILVQDRRTHGSIRANPATRGSPAGLAAPIGTMSKGLLSPERPAVDSKGDSLVLTATALSHLVKKKGAGLPVPSPRTLAQMPIPRNSVPGRQVLLCDPSVWLHIEAYFTIQALQLYEVADSEATGVIDIMRGGMSEPHFVASVQPMDAIPRALMIAAAEKRGRPLCSCAPASVLSGASSSGFCSELEFRDNRGRPWGALVSHGPYTFTVCKQGSREALLVEGDQASGRLVVWLGDEVVAHAAMDNDCTQLEVGVKPHSDPLLMLSSVLAVLIFNPEDPGHMSPEPSCL